MSSGRSRRGALVGAGIGGLLRGGLTFVNLGGLGTSSDAWPFLGVVSLPSLVIGAICGALAGCSRSPARGALWGAVLAALTFVAFAAPTALVAGFFGAADKVEQFSLPYLLQRVVAGAVAGAVGVLAGRAEKGAPAAVLIDEEPETAV
jgi:hypothetical protein